MAAKKSDPVLSLKNISKSYQMDGVVVNALSDIDLDIYPGDFLAILGPSGSGKSTLMHIAGFLDKPTTGDVFINGQKVVGFTESRLATIRNKTIGFIFQQFNLLPRTSSLDNVALPLVYSHISESDRIKKAKAMLDLVGLSDRTKNHPNQLSGGQQQRVAIARALVTDPQIIFADEPTGNLDSKSGDEIMDFLTELNRQGRTIILVTHEQEVADYAHRTIYIRDGRVVSDKVSLKHKKPLTTID